MRNVGEELAASHQQREVHAPEAEVGRWGRAVPWGMQLALPGILVLVVFTCFLPTLGNDFVAWDDDLNFTENPNYRGLSWSNLRWMLTTVHGGHYQPLSWMTLGLDYVVWGMSPTGYHLTNLLLHAANAVAFYLVVAALLRRLSPSGSGMPAAAAVGALLFAIHPLRVEAVAWASERRDVLSGFFYLIAVLAYLRMQNGARGRWLAVSLGSFVLSLLSEAWGITLPVVLLALDLYPLRRGLRARVLLEKAPYGLIALAFAVLAFRAQAPIEAMRTLAQHGVIARVAQAAYGLWFYLGKTLVPVGLSPLYLLELQLDPMRPRYVLAILGVVGLTAGLVLLRHCAPGLLAAWVCYAVIVSPVLGFVQTGPQIAADRYTYLACLPWAVLLAGGVRALARGREAGRLRLGTWYVPMAAVVMTLAVLGALTFAQTRIWRDSRTLWEYVLRIDPTNYVAYTNRGIVRYAAGDKRGALADYNSALAIHPGYALAYYDRGSARHALGDVDGAITDLSFSIQLNPRDPRAWNNRGWAREAKGDLAGALADYAEALRRAPADFPGRGKIEENRAAMQALGG
ncbi:MAG: tetratricopeptide repeat protein [Deltaproteobacteria bacterium]|nr:MAG: tetratricopeptide repeat protein [Deltaproteobacteria bacterium]